MRTKAVAVAALTLLAPLACSSAELEQPATPAGDSGADADVTAAREAVTLRSKVPMDDGTGLDTRVFVPARSKRLPTILVRNPYPHADDDEAIAAAARFHNARGYAYVWQSVRGTSASEGTFYPYVDEVRDGVATTAWIAAQDWSDGSLGTIGGSYLAFTALAAAVSNPRVKIVISDDGTLDERSSHRGGVVWGYLLNWLNLVQRGSFFDTQTQYPVISNTLDPLSLDTTTLAGQSNYWRDFIEHIDEPKFPLAGSLDEKISELCVPVLHVYSPSTGWNDPVDIHRALTTRGCAAQRASQRLYVVTEPHTHHLGLLESERTYVNDAMLAALDRVLLEHASDLGTTPAVSFAVEGEAAPRSASAWPPPDTSTRTLYFDAAPGEAPMRATPPAAAGQVSLPSDPAGDPCAAGGRGEQQWFTSDALEQPIVIAGAPRIELSFRTALRDFDLFAKMYDYDPAGDTYALIASASVRARYREGGAPTLVTPAALERVTLDFVHVAHRLAAGHVVTVSLAPSECGYLENPQTGAALTAQTARAAGTITIETGGLAPSSLRLPLLP